MKTLLCTTAVALALGLTPALAQTSAPAPMAAPAPATVGAQLSEQDRTFAMKAAQGGMAEVEAGKLAASKAMSADVKQFGQKMVDDHTQANDKLKAIAQKKSITLPTTPDAEHRQGHDQLTTLIDAQFDRHYVQMMVMDHQKTVDLFRTQASGGGDADLKSFAQATLPTLEQHLKTVQDLNRTMQPMASTPAPASAGAIPAIDAKLGRMTAKDLIGKDVVNARGQEVGEIENVVMSTDRTVHAVIGVGGFLGMGEKDVMLPLHQLKIGSDDAILMSDVSEDALKQLPAYRKDGFEELPRDRRIVE